MRLREKIDTIRNTVAKGATNAQLEMFLTVAERYQLDPFLKEIWYSPDVGIMCGRDGYLKIAMRNPNYEGVVSAAVREGDVFTMEPLVPTVKHQFGLKRGAVIGAYAVAFHKGRRPAVCYADMAEYRKGGNIWAKYQSAMIQKVAEVMALKRQFAISGLTSEEETPTPSTTEEFTPPSPPQPPPPPERAPNPAASSRAQQAEAATGRMYEAAQTTVTGTPLKPSAPPPSPETNLPPQLQEIFARMVKGSRADREHEFHMLLAALQEMFGTDKGRDMYGNVLRSHGVEHCSQFSALSKAKLAIADLFDLLSNGETVETVEEEPEGN